MTGGETHQEDAPACNIGRHPFTDRESLKSEGLGPFKCKVGDVEQGSKKIVLGGLVGGFGHVPNQAEEDENQFRGDSRPVFTYVQPPSGRLTHIHIRILFETQNSGVTERSLI